MFTSFLRDMGIDCIAVMNQWRVAFGVFVNNEIKSLSCLVCELLMAIIFY